jgi:Peptidase A4 family
VNWGGYADIETGSKTAKGVSADWTIPRVTCLQGTYKNQDAFASQWVGLDGATNGTVEQLGSGEQCYEGVLYYYVWYEMFPAGTVQEGTLACINNNVDCPRPGDRISASVTAKPGDAGDNRYVLTLKDHTTPGNNFSVTKQCDVNVCLDQSAEWIIERPAFALGNGFQILPLVYYGKNGFSHGTVTSGGVTTSIAGFTGGSVNDVFTVDDSIGYYLQCIGQSGPPGQLLLFSNPNACPTVSPTDGGGSFTDTWDSSF